MVIRANDIAQVQKHLLSICKSLGLIPSTKKKQREKKKILLIDWQKCCDQRLTDT
jgi:hypothetical protein